MNGKQIRVTIEDLATGDRETVEIADDYIFICAGNTYLTSTQSYPKTGTHILTVKRQEPEVGA